MNIRQNPDAIGLTSPSLMSSLTKMGAKPMAVAPKKSFNLALNNQTYFPDFALFAALINASPKVADAP